MTQNFYQIRDGLTDLREGFKRFELWHRLAKSDLKLSYKQTFFGAAWFPLSLLIFSVGLAFVFASFFGQSFKYFLPYVLTGMLVWGLLSRIISESCKIFVQSAGIIIQIDAPLSVHLFRVIELNLLIFLNELLVVIPIVLVVAQPNFTGLSLFILSIPLIVLFAFSVAMINSILCTRYPDIANLIGLGMRFMFFLTPVFWIPAGNTLRDQLVILSPLYHAIEVARSPLLGNHNVMFSWVFLIGTTVPLLLIGILAFCKFRVSLKYWI